MRSDTNAVTVDTAAYTINERWLRRVVARGAGLPADRVIPANTNWPAPQVAGDSFATVLLTTDTAIGRTLQRDFADGNFQQIWQHRRAVYRIQFFSQASLVNGASARAARFCVWSGSDDALLVCEGALTDPDDGWPAGLQVRFDHPIDYARLDGLDDSEWEERAYCDLTCRYYLHHVVAEQPINPSTIHLARNF